MVDHLNAEGNLELDVVIYGDDTAEETAAALVDGIDGAWVCSVTDVGPSGWPLVEVMGDGHALWRVFQRYNSPRVGRKGL